MGINASTAKPASISACVYVGPANSTKLPKSANKALDSEMVSVGYISDEGVTNSYSIESDDIKCWGGITVLSPLTSKEDKFSFTMISPTNEKALGLVFGDNNVTVAESADSTTGIAAGNITVVADSADLTAHSFVIEMIVDGVAARMVIPNGKVSDIGDISYTDSDAIGYEVTITALADSTDKTHYMYYNTTA